MFFKRLNEILEDVVGELHCIKNNVFDVAAEMRRAKYDLPKNKPQAFPLCYHDNVGPLLFISAGDAGVVVVFRNGEVKNVPYNSGLRLTGGAIYAANLAAAARQLADDFDRIYEMERKRK